MNKMRSKREFSKEAISSTKLCTVLANVFYSNELDNSKKTKVYFINNKGYKIYLSGLIKKSDLTKLILKQNSSVFRVPFELIP